MLNFKVSLLLLLFFIKSFLNLPLIYRLRIFVVLQVLHICGSTKQNLQGEPWEN